MANHVLRVQAREIVNALTHIGDHRMLPARARLRNFLVELGSNAVPGDKGAELPLRDWEIAQCVNVTPPYLSTLLSELVREGMLRRIGGKLLMIPRAGQTTGEPRGRTSGVVGR